MKSSSVSNGIKRLKFAKKHSSGLRIRAQPSLQAEQIGIIDLEGLIEYNDEVVLCSCGGLYYYTRQKIYF